MTQPPPPTVYTIDAANRIVDVNEAWLAFARANTRGAMTRTTLLGRCLLDFVTDVPTRQIYETILGNVRRHQRAVTVHFRCDGPTERRFMTLEAAPSGDLITFTCRTVRLEPRPSVVLLEADVPRSGDILLQCSWCKKVKVEEDWCEAEVAVERLRLFEAEAVPQLSHGICPTCAAQFAIPPPAGDCPATHRLKIRRHCRQGLRDRGDALLDFQ